MKAIAKTRFIHGAISAKKGDEIEANESVIKELQAAGLVSVSQDSKSDAVKTATQGAATKTATKTARKTAAKTAGA